MGGRPCRWATAASRRGGAFWTQGAAIDGLFETVADATEEAALNALFQAVTVTGGDRHVLHALPVERTLDLLRG